MLITFGFGIKALIIGQIASSFLVFIYSLYVIYLRLKIKIIVLASDLLKLIMICIIIHYSNNYILISLIDRSALLLLLQLIILPVFYFVLAYAFKVKGLYTLVEVFSNYLPLKIKRLVDNILEN